ncbi:pyridoxamine 5'-phosphate oxidase family protein [Corynebacterium endometrii]|jgi:nitroimidazol reductase NimA-like FMN-containing flavoprotein (pyridoxamine 5'-phosphate oxidase superfamily)|uniref:Pyridoxamine 5'-phosphate oxidase n=1 Tax=Corynebacterium endometrii TaxID=2488819 RepID=A0A4P7QHI5_9CORY|nr:pyridoxamine 5'-phosphate oxidase family protein [Corynebacterium endometrii]QCB29109.1 Pyridoxamine 5'-phosphate oxidase [Corynebacterium endometrii]
MNGHDNHNEAINKMAKEESLERLATQELGRLVVRRKDDMDIFPVNYALDGESVYFRTAEGSKLFSVSLNHDVLFEVDHVEGDKAWSVVIKGEAEVLKSYQDIEKADELPLKPWLPTLKYNYVRINAREISGRYFNLGEEPERYQG